MRSEKMGKGLRRCLYISAVLVGLGLSQAALAVDDVFPAMSTQMQKSASNVANQLVPYALRLLGVLFLIQFALRNYKTAFSVDDPKQLLAKLVFPMLWLGFLMYLIGNSYGLLNAIFSSFLALGRVAAGGVDLQPGNIMWNGIALQNNMVIAYNEATGASDGLLNAFKYFFPSMMLSVACLAILISFFVIALAVAIATLEFFLILAAAPIAFAMGGLEALKQSSIAPLQTMLSIGYRLIILGVIVGVMNDQLVPWSNNFKTVTAANLAPIWIVVFGCLLGAVCAFSAGKIAGALASGQSNISGNEAMFAGLQMMQTIATTMTAAASAGQLAGGVADAASKGAGGAGAAAGRGFVNLSEALGGGSGSISNGGNGANNGGGAGGHGRAGGMNSADAAQSLLGPMGGDPVGAADEAGDATDAGVSGSGAPSETGSSGGASGDDSRASSAGAPPAATPQTSEDRVSKALDNMADAMRGQRPGTGTQLGRAAMGSVQGMQHDSGHVQVHVDTHSRD